jgi:hypothetical protein
VTSRDQPPVSNRLRAAEKENFRFGMVPSSVSGDASRSGFSISSGTLRGPMIVPPRSPRIGSGTWTLAG